MGTENFFRRWSRLKRDGGQESSDTEKTSETRPQTRPLSRSDIDQSGLISSNTRAVTFEDVAKLTSDSDYSVFVDKGVDKAVQRSAMKKLFSDPHFNRMDGLDVYIDDYTKFTPLPAAIIAGLQHAKSVLAPQHTEDAAPDNAELNKPESTEGIDSSHSEIESAVSPAQGVLHGNASVENQEQQSDADQISPSRNDNVPPHKAPYDDI